MKTIKPFIFILLSSLWLFHLSSAQAENVDSYFHEGNSLYAKGEYQEAIKKYEAALQTGAESANLYFNLANSTVKLGQKGKGILYYKKALQLKPRDAECKYNLRFLESQLEDRVIPKAQNIFIRKYGALIDSLSEREWSHLFLFVFLFVFAIALLSLFWIKRRKECLRVLFAAAIVLVLTSGFLIGKVIHLNQPAGIVMTKEVKARYGPSEQDVAAFTLHEGTFCQILGSSKDWFQIRLLDGKVAWLPKTAVEQI